MSEGRERGFFGSFSKKTLWQEDRKVYIVRCNTMLYGVISW